MGEKLAENTASSEAKRRSQAAARLQPAPTAGPPTMAMVGLGIRCSSMAAWRSWRDRSPESASGGTPFSLPGAPRPTALDVAARAEAAVAPLGCGAGEDDHLGVGVVGHLAHGVVEGADELAVERVAPRRAVQRDGPDPVRDLRQDHGLLSSAVAAEGSATAATVSSLGFLGTNSSILKAGIASFREHLAMTSRG